MHHSPIIQIAGLNIDLSIVLMLLVTCTVCFVLAKLATRNLSVDNPGKLQNFMEWLVEFVQGLVTSTMDLKKGKVFISLGMTLMLFIFVANLLGLPFAVVTEHDKPASVFGYELYHTSADELEKIKEKQEEKNAAKGINEEVHPHVGLVWWKSPTADASVTMGLALMIFLLVHFLGATRNSKAYFKHYFEPYIFFLPLNLIKEASKLLTHGMRLFGNIFAGEVLISTLIGAGIFGIPALAVWQGFSLFVGAMQAFVFTILTMVYLSQALENHHEHEEHH